ncbi:MAG: rhodanese-like domain-containing protein [Verrucomicrobiia bacterium]
MKKVTGIFLIGMILLDVNGMTPAELKKKIDAGEDVTIVDVRPTDLYQKGHIPGAINIPLAICDQKRLPGAKLVVVYDEGLHENKSAAAIDGLKKKNQVQAEILEGGFAAWETFIGTTTKQSGATREEMPYITYDALKKLQSADTVIVDLRTAVVENKSLAGKQQAPALTDLQSEFPKAKIVKSPFASGINKKSLSAAQYTPLFVIVDNGDGKAQEMARTLKANGISRFVILAGGEKILERQGKAGLQRTGTTFTAPVKSDKNN